MRIMLRFAAAAALTAAVAGPALAPNGPVVAGTWQSTYGALDFTVTDIKDDQGAVIGKAASAPYKSEGGTVSGELKGATLVGYWHEPHSSLACKTKRAGTLYWGRVEFAFTGESYEGKWGYCDEKPERGWSGTRG